MTDFYPLVLAALSKLDPDTEEARQALYERARTRLGERLREIEPPVSAQRIMEERLAFEEAVRRAEADWARGLVERELLAQLADKLEADPALAQALQRPRHSWTRLAATLRQSPSGGRFEYTAGAFGFAATGTEADRAAAADALARSIRSELEYKARDLVGRAARFSDRALWSSLIDPLRMLVERIGGPEAQVASEIGIVWALHVALGAMIEPREDRESRDVLALPETDMLRALRALVAACGPWIGTFPAGRVFDDPAPSPPPAIAEAAATFLRGAEDAGLLRDDAAAVIRAILEGIDHRGPFADKAGNWVVLTANNLTIAMLLVLAQIAQAYENGAASPESPQAARSIERLVLEQEKHLPRLFSHLPDDIRQELHAAVDAIRASAADDV